MRLDFHQPRIGRRKVSLAPMIDVVFLLLIFFMLAAQMGRDSTVSMRPAAPNASTTMIYEGPPRLVALGADHLMLNGQVIDAADLIPALHNLIQEDASEAAQKIILRPEAGATVQQLLSLMAALRAGGLDNLAVIE